MSMGDGHWKSGEQRGGERRDRPGGQGGGYSAASRAQSLPSMPAEMRRLKILHRKRMKEDQTEDGDRNGSFSLDDDSSSSGSHNQSTAANSMAASLSDFAFVLDEDVAAEAGKCSPGGRRSTRSQTFDGESRLGTFESLKRDADKDRQAKDGDGRPTATRTWRDDDWGKCLSGIE